MNKYTVFNHSGRWVSGARAKFGLLTFFVLLLAFTTATALNAYVRTGGTGASVTFGEIEEFGSIVVNGIHYDESAANIVVDGIAGQPRSALKLGMIVQIDGVRDYTRNTGIANLVKVNRVLFGQVESINAGTSELKVLQQRVMVSATTRFDGSPGFGELVEGDWIAVHGLDDPGRKTVVATLVERVIPPMDASSSIRGTVLKSKSGSLRIGKLDILVANNEAQDGDFVSVTGDYLGGVLVASAAIVTREVETRENDETELQGYVADFRGIDSFTIAGVMVDASAARFAGGRASDLRRDVRVTVEGTIRNGVLIAEEVEFSQPTSSKASDELEGVITSFSSIADFVVKGRRVDASRIGIRYDKLPQAGWKAHLAGSVSAEGIFVATKAEFERD